MAKWYGMIGYGKTVETAPSVFTENGKSPTLRSSFLDLF